VTNNAPAVFNEGINTVTWTATDTHAQTASATQQVKVIDKTPPTFTFVPGDITVNDCGPVDVGHATAVDDCAEPPRVHSNAPFFFHVGPTTVTWVARDDEGNRTKAKQIVTVIDTHPPELWCKRFDDDDHDHDHGHGFGIKHDAGDDLYRVWSKDKCTAYPSVRLGGFGLENGEVIKLTPVSHPGVQFVGFARPWHVRHFLVGPGAAIVTSTDGSGNVATVSCPVSPHHQ
jgi:hypothetical protein